jgi:hypothetical protein
LGHDSSQLNYDDSETLRPSNGQGVSTQQLLFVRFGRKQLMPIRRRRLLYTLAVLLASLDVGCKEQSSQTQTLPPAAPSNSSSPAVTNINAAPPSNANAASSNKGTVDACKLLTADEIQNIQHDTLKDIKPTARTGGTFIISQCFYATSQFVNSVSLTVTQQNSDTGAESIRELWKQRFWTTGSHDRERESERDNKAKASEEEEKGAPPERVEGIGEEAYSVGNAKFGALYVLKGNKILRISVGGSHSQPERIQKMKRLAQYAVSRL